MPRRRMSSEQVESRKRGSEQALDCDGDAKPGSRGFDSQSRIFKAAPALDGYGEAEEVLFANDLLGAPPISELTCRK